MEKRLKDEENQKCQQKIRKMNSRFLLGWIPTLSSSLDNIVGWQLNANA